MNEFAKRLKLIRKAQKLTQERLAEKAGITRSMVARYETGQVTPSIEVLLSLANALNVTTDYLLGRDLVAEKEQELQSNNAHPSADRTTPPSQDYPRTIGELKDFILDVVGSSKTETKHSQ